MPSRENRLFSDGQGGSALSCGLGFAVIPEVAEFACHPATIGTCSVAQPPTTNAVIKTALVPTRPIVKLTGTTRWVSHPK